MAKFKVIVSDPASGKAAVTEIEGAKAQALVGRTLGEVIDGGPLGIGSTKLRITGGCDKDGIPMRSDVHGGGKKYIVLSGGVGFHPREDGERRRKLVRGGVITDETYQVNAVVVKGEAAKRAVGPTPQKAEASKPSTKKPTKKAKATRKR